MTLYYIAFLITFKDYNNRLYTKADYRHLILPSYTPAPLSYTTLGILTVVLYIYPSFTPKSLLTTYKITYYNDYNTAR